MGQVIDLLQYKLRRQGNATESEADVIARAQRIQQTIANINLLMKQLKGGSTNDN